MRQTYGILFWLLCLAVASPALGQRRVDKLETSVKNVEGDLEVLQEFIQDQSKALQKLKKRVQANEKLKSEINTVNAKIATTASALHKTISVDIDELAQQNAKASKQIEAIEKKLKKRVKFFGQVRVRPEYRENSRDFNSDLDEDQNFMTSHRARIGMLVEPVKGVKGKFSLQDARVWGTNPLAGLDDPAVQFHEAFVDIQLKKDVASLVLGRQELKFGAQRMVGAPNWGQSGVSFDAMNLKLKYKNYVKGSVLLSWLDERNAISGDDELFGGYYVTIPYVKGIDIDQYFLVLWDDRSEAQRKIGTLGARVAGDLPWHTNLFFDLEASIQFGTVSESAPKADIFADAAAGPGQTPKDQTHFAAAYYAELGYKIPVKTYDPKVSVFFHSASGDGNTSPTNVGNDTHTSFVPLFPTNHALFGKMDLFKMSNIVDLGVRAAAKLGSGWSTRVEGHYFSLVSATGPLVGHGDTGFASIPWGDSKALGTEFDLDVTYRFNKHVAFMAGYSVFLPAEEGAIQDRVIQRREEPDPDDPAKTQTWEYPSGDPAHWLFFQADFTF